MKKIIVGLAASTLVALMFAAEPKAKTAPPPTAYQVAAILRRLGIVPHVSDRGFLITSSGMEPTLRCSAGIGCSAKTDDRVMIRPYASGQLPRRGDIVAFKTPPRTVKACGVSGILIKRVIALPSETWSEKHGLVYINSKSLRERYTNPQLPDHTSHAKVSIPPGRYFVMGDNRTESCDSRYWGTLPATDILGKAIAIYWPAARARRI